MYKLVLTLSVLSVVLTIASCISAVEDLQKKNELRDSVDDKIEMLMSNINRHCEVLNQHTNDTRKKRGSEDEISHSLRQGLEDCVPRSAEDVNPTEPPPTLSIHGQCTSPLTVNLTGAWRRDLVGSHHKPAHGFYACDRQLQAGAHWFRFTGTGGSMMSNTCPQAYSCGAHGGFWSNATMPTRVGEIRRVPIYGSWNGNCQRYTWPTVNPMLVQRCSSRPGDFVYRVFGTSSCYWTFCGMNVLPN